MCVFVCIVCVCVCLCVCTHVCVCVYSVCVCVCDPSVSVYKLVNLFCVHMTFCFRICAIFEFVLHCRQIVKCSQVFFTTLLLFVF